MMMNARFVKIDLKIRRRGQQQDRQKGNRFNKQNNNFALASHFFCPFFLASLHDHDIKMHDFHFTVDIKQKNEFSLYFSAWIWFLGIQLQE